MQTIPTPRIPVLNFPAMAPVPFSLAIRMIHTGKARPVGPKGAETGLELLFSGLDTAIADPKGPSYAESHSTCGRNRVDVIDWDGNDPNIDMPVLQAPCRGDYRTSGL